MLTLAISANRKKLICLTAVSCVMLLVFSLLASPVLAFSPNYVPSNLIDNPTLLDNATMSAGIIQVFLSNIGSGLANLSDTEACDATIAPYYSHCGQSISAAQIIYDTSQAYSINPRAILATLEKEQSLVTDPAPSASQINCAMGYNSCSGYSGFFTQVDNGTWALRYNYEGAQRHATWLSWHPGANYPCQSASSLYNNGLYPANSVTFADPGGTAETITLANAATASLYCYTPYVGPYNVTGYSGSYNFVYYFQLWFGSTQASVAYAWNYVSQAAFVDSGHTQPFTAIPTVLPGGDIYAQVQARNVGYQTWSKTSLHLGTSNPDDRTSSFYDSSWLNAQRPSALTENSVAPGDVGTFNFILHAPAQAGSYNEYFNLVEDGLTWLNDPGLFFTINVNSSATPKNNNFTLSANQSLTTDSVLLSADGQTALTLQRDGNLVEYSNFTPSWSTGVLGSSASKLIMQPDGNLVVYDRNNHPLWDSETQNNAGARLVLQTDGNMVIYSSTNQPLWATYTLQTPDHTDYINTTLNGGRMYPGQSIDTADRRFHLIFQPDGNVVLYSPTKALWATGTDGESVAFLAMQPDGNLVLYGPNGRPLWFSSTSGRGMARLIVQQDGNLVLYNPYGTALWNTATAGSQ